MDVRRPVIFVQAGFIVNEELVHNTCSELLFLFYIQNFPQSELINPFGGREFDNLLVTRVIRKIQVKSLF